MDIIGAISIVAMPFVVKGVTNWAKQLASIPLMTYRVTIVRAIVAVLSVVGAILSQWIGETQLDPELVQTAALAVLNAAVATWFYLKEKGTL